MNLTCRHLCSGWFLLISLCLFSVQAHAQIETEADYAFLLDADTQTVLFEKKADELMPPASMSKLMTLAVVFEALEEGKITLQTEFPVSENAWRTGGAPSRTSAMFAPLKTQVTVEDLLQGVIVQSANDACIVLAEGLAGSEDAFAQMMTEQAKKIGLTKSTFGNSTGLPHPKQLMTARELAKLGYHLITKYQKYYHYFQQKEFRYRKHIFQNLNPLIYANLGADGLKTGFTEESGYGIVGSAVDNARRLIIVQNGVKTQSGRKDEATRMLNWGFKSFEKFTIFNPDEIVGEAVVWGGEHRYLKLRGDGGGVRMLLPKNIKQRKIRGAIVYLGPVIAPVKEGDRIGELRVTADNGITSAAPLFAAESIEKSGMIRQGFDFILAVFNSAFDKVMGKLMRRHHQEE